MNDTQLLERRKQDHLRVVLDGLGPSPSGMSRAASGFDALIFEHCALPELHLDEIDLTASFLGHTLQAPWLISSMTGGPREAGRINTHLAEAASQIGVAFAVGSQRVAIEGGAGHGLDHSLRAKAKNIPLLANFGAAQLNKGFGVEEARRAVDMIEADALIIHLNPLQEAVQPEGDRDWRGILRKIEALVRHSSVPVIVKEIGCGLSGPVAERLLGLAVAGIDVAGAGGTSWAAVEAARADDPVDQAVAQAFATWGIPTVRAIETARAVCPKALIIGSGGIRHGVDAAKAIALGADLVGQAAGSLPAALHSTEAVIEHLTIMIRQLRIACFCTGSRYFKDLREVQLLRQDRGSLG